MVSGRVVGQASRLSMLTEFVIDFDIETGETPVPSESGKANARLRRHESGESMEWSRLVAQDKSGAKRGCREGNSARTDCIKHRVITSVTSVADQQAVRNERRTCEAGLFKTYRTGAPLVRLSHDVVRHVTSGVKFRVS